MKHHSMLNSFCSLAIGLAGVTATVNAPWAADVGMPVLEKRSAKTMAVQPQRSMAATTARHPGDANRNVKGALGPIRRDYNDPMAGANAEMLRRDLRMGRYPSSNQASIP